MKDVQHVTSLYLPERGELERIVIKDNRKKKKILTVGGTIRDLVRAYILKRGGKVPPRDGR